MSNPASEVIERTRLLLPDVEITSADIKAPTSQFVFNFYKSCLTELGVDNNSLLQIQANQASLIDNYEMHSAIIPMLNLYKAVNFFLLNIGIHDFGLSDILNPNPKRNTMLMSTMLNFIYYCDQKLEAHHEDIDRLGYLRTRRKELLDKREELKTILNKRTQEGVFVEEKKNKLDEAITTKKKMLDDLMEEKGEVKVILEQGKEEMNKMEQEHAKLFEKERAYREELVKTEGLLVQFPEKLKGEMEQLTNKKELVINNCNEMRSKVEEKKDLANLLSTEISNQEQRTMDVTNLLEWHKKCSDIEGSIENMKKAQRESATKIKELQEKKKHLEEKRITEEKTLTEMKEKHVEQNEKHKESKKMLEIEIQQQMVTCSEVEKIAASLSMNIEKDEMILMDIENNFEKLKIKFEQAYESLNKQEEQTKKKYENLIKGWENNSQ